MSPFHRARPKCIALSDELEAQTKSGSHFAVVLACGTLLAIATLVALCWPESAVRP